MSGLEGAEGVGHHEQEVSGACVEDGVKDGESKGGRAFCGGQCWHTPPMRSLRQAGLAPEGITCISTPLHLHPDASITASFPTEPRHSSRPPLNSELQEAIRTDQSWHRG